MFKSLVKDLLRLFDLEVRRLPTLDPLKRLIPPEMRQLYWLKQLQIKTVIDIGANKGQFAQGICQVLPDARIYAFEPLPSCYDELVTTFNEKPYFKAFNVALGNEAGQISMYQNEFSPSSSLLPLAELHKKTFPFAQEVLAQEVKVIKLDDIAESLELCEPILVKIDVQGFEDKVIEGGSLVLQKASVIIIELSILTLYEGQPLFDGVYQKLISLGFKYYGNLDQAQNTDGQILYVDSIFVKEQIANWSR